MEGIDAFNLAEVYFWELQQIAAKEYNEKIESAYKKANERYKELLEKK